MGRLKENIGAMDFKLSDEDMESINAINEGVRICDNYPWLFGTSIFA